MNFNQTLKNLISKDRNVVSLIFVLAFAVFGNTIFNENSLDDEYIFNTLEALGEDASLKDVFNSRYNNVDYRPVTVATFYFEKSLGIDNVHTSHFINVLLYAILCIVVYLTIARFNIKHARYIALLTALFFIIHPSHSNVVASLKNRDCILSALFGMMALYTFIMALNKRNILFLLLVPVFVFIGMLSKLDTLVFLGILPLTYLQFHLDRRFNKNLLLRIVTLGIFTILLYQLVLVKRNIQDEIETEKIVMDGESVTSVDFEENPIVGNHSKPNLIAYGIQTSMKYMSFMVKPTGYWFYFGYNMMPVRSLTHPMVLVGIGIHLLLLFLFIYGFIQKWPLAYGIGFYILAIFPFLNIMQPVAGIYAVRYSFIASIGFVLALSAILIMVYHNGYFINWIKSHKTRQRIVSALVFMIVTICTFYCIQRNKDWENKNTLFLNDIKHLENSFNSNFILGSYFLELFEQEKKFRNKNTLKKSLKYLNQANLVYAENSQNYAQMGHAYFYLGNRKEAEKLLLKSHDLEHRNIKTLMLLSDYYLSESNHELAEKYLFKAINIDVNIKKSGLYFKLTNLYNQIGRHDEALSLNLNLITDDSLDYVLYQNLGNTYLFLKDTVSAVRYFNRSLKLGLDDPVLESQIKDYYEKK